MQVRRQLARAVIAAILAASADAVAQDEVTDPSEVGVDPCVLAPVLDGCTGRTGLPLLLQAVPEFWERLARDGAVPFRAWNGLRVGMDSDTEIVFFSDGTVGMLEYGYDLQRYLGIYRVDEDGRISIAFASFPRGWPDMTLERDATDLLLRPVDPRIRFVMGSRGAATLIGGRAYWPFRTVTEPEEAKLIARLQGWF